MRGDAEASEQDNHGVVPIDWATLWALDARSVEWSIPQILPRGREGAIYGSAGVGKSLFAADIAAAKATGRSVLGSTPVAPVSVVYIDAEMTTGDLQERLIDLGYGPGDDLARLHYFQLQSFPPLDTRNGGDALMAIVQRFQPETVILDTMTALVEGDESSADTYRAFHRFAARQVKAAGVSLLRIDHEGKDPGRGQRGSSAKGDEADVIWRLTTNGEQLELKNTKRRVPYVQSNLGITRHAQPKLHHVLKPASSLKGAGEIAMLLDKLGVPLDASAAKAIDTLKEAGEGRRKEAVLAALKLRRDQSWVVLGTDAASSCAINPEQPPEPVLEAGHGEHAERHSPVPGTNRNHGEPPALPTGSWFPLSKEGTMDEGESQLVLTQDFVRPICQEADRPTA
jgi:KaiC/GvpD/RAD55 family RecA-like ATPase